MRQNGEERERERERERKKKERGMTGSEGGSSNPCRTRTRSGKKPRKKNFLPKCPDERDVDVVDVGRRSCSNI